jgi:hypothetical protein
MEDRQEERSKETGGAHELGAPFPPLGRRNLDVSPGLHVAGEILVLATLYGSGRKEARGLGVPRGVVERDETGVPREKLASGGATHR